MYIRILISKISLQRMLELCRHECIYVPTYISSMCARVYVCGQSNFIVTIGVVHTSDGFERYHKSAAVPDCHLTYS
jgi:hypothetical protein